MVTSMRLSMLTVLEVVCIWNSDTLRGEMQTHADTFNLISGQFPHHRKASYEARIGRNLGALKADPARVEV